MEYKEAKEILLKMVKEGKMNEKEKEALLKAVGVLDFAVLGKNRLKSIIKAKKEKRDKSVEW